MEKKKSDMKMITFYLHEDLKNTFDTHCRKMGLSLAEYLRCVLLGKLDEVPEEDLTAMIEKLTVKRDGKRRKRNKEE